MNLLDKMLENLLVLIDEEVDFDSDGHFLIFQHRITNKSKISRYWAVSWKSPWTPGV